jgi:ABC-type Fe3+ transport system substrate-binding protein
MNYFNENNTLYEITDKYPETIPVFSSNGFPQMDDSEQREKFGKGINLKTALMLKKIDVSIFTNLLLEVIKQDNNSIDATLNENKKIDHVSAINVVGLLPCPVRIPLLEEFTGFHKSYTEETGLIVNYELKAASMGLDWVEENLVGITDAGDLPDLFISAGFDMFFDKKMIGKFKDADVFEDATGIQKFNSLFDDIDLKDPAGHYSMIGVVPAVFLINTVELGDIPMPRTWEDILSPDFEKRVSLPVGDFDLFNGILINIHKNYGDEGLRKLGRSLLESMHPSQMVKSDRKKSNRPIVTIMPYFFTKMVKEGGTMAAVWPEDGAIISPIFMLSKKERTNELQSMIDFFASKKVGEILSHSGLFPSIHPDVDNRISEKNKFMWPGWDYIYSQDISVLIKHCVNIFNESLG